MTLPDDEWIKMLDAAVYVAPKLGLVEGKRFLAEAMRDQLIAARAEHIGQSLNRGGLIWPSFWDGFEPDKDLPRWDWARGLVVTGTNPEALLSVFYREASGVTLSRSDLLRLVGQPSQGVEEKPVPAASRAGRKVDAGRWTVFWMAVVKIAKAGRLERGCFSSQAELTDEILAEMGDGAFSPDHVRNEVRAIWLTHLS